MQIAQCDRSVRALHNSAASKSGHSKICNIHFLGPLDGGRTSFLANFLSQRRPHNTISNYLPCVGKHSLIQNIIRNKNLHPGEKNSVTRRRLHNLTIGRKWTDIQHHRPDSSQPIGPISKKSVR